MSPEILNPESKAGTLNQLLNPESFFEFAVELKWRIHQSKGLIKVVFVLMPIDDGRW